MSLRICYALPRTTQKMDTSSMMERLHCFIQRTPACASPWSVRTRVQLLTFADQAWPHLKGRTARVLYLKSYIYICIIYINQWEFHDHEMAGTVPYRLGPYLVGIFPYIALTQALYNLYMVGHSINVVVAAKVQTFKASNCRQNSLDSEFRGQFSGPSWSPNGPTSS